MGGKCRLTKNLAFTIIKLIAKQEKEGAAFMRQPLSYSQKGFYMSLLDKMERKFGKYAIPNLMQYIIILYVLGMILRIATPGVYETYFMLDASQILRGQIWRIFTFLLQSPSDSLLFFIITLYFYYMIGSVLERTWGSFRFNVYYFTGVIGTVLAAIIIYLITGRVYYLDTTYINASLFLAFAFEYPDMEVLLMFIFPIKMKWLAYIDMALYAYSLVVGNWGTRIAIIVSLLNFILFFSSYLISIFERKHYHFTPLNRHFSFHKPVWSIEAFDLAVLDSFESLVKIGGYIIFFSVLLTLCQQIPFRSPVFQIIFSSLEITNGLKLLANLPFSFQTRYILCVGLTAFGGFCSVAQTNCMLHDTGLSICSYTKQKLAAAVTASILCMLYCKI